VLQVGEAGIEEEEEEEASVHEEHGLRVSENTVLRRISGSMTEEATGGWRSVDIFKVLVQVPE
jgi:hypothetical protein